MTDDAIATTNAQLTAQKSKDKAKAALNAAIYDLLLALNVIASFPITNPENQDAHNLQLIATHALEKLRG